MSCGFFGLAAKPFRRSQEHCSMPMLRVCRRPCGTFYCGECNSFGRAIDPHCCSTDASCAKGDGIGVLKGASPCIRSIACLCWDLVCHLARIYGCQRDDQIRRSPYECGTGGWCSRRHLSPCQWSAGQDWSNHSKRLFQIPGWRRGCRMERDGKPESVF